MKSRLVLFQVCSDPPGELPFDPMGNCAHLTQREALADLRDNRRHTPESYLAKIQYRRVSETRKGR